MNKIKHNLYLFAGLFLVWVLLTSLNSQEIVAGVIVSAIIVWLMQKMKPVLGAIHYSPKAIAFSISFFFIFIKELILSNLDVARRVFSPSLPLNPGIVKVHTNLTSDIGKLVLANSITLTPGTLTTEIKDDLLYIHWIDITAEDMDGATQEIVKKFEKYLEVIFG